MQSPGTEAAAISGKRYRAPLLGAIAWLAGLGLIAGLIGARNFDQVASAPALAGWSMLLIGVACTGVLLADTLSWRALLARSERPGLGSMVVKRWIGGSINGLLPVAQVGGDIVRAHLLARAGVAGPVAGASVVLDATSGSLRSSPSSCSVSGCCSRPMAAASGCSGSAPVWASSVWPCSDSSSCSSAGCFIASPAWSSAPRAVGGGWI